MRFDRLVLMCLLCFVAAGVWVQSLGDLSLRIGRQKEDMAKVGHWYPTQESGIRRQ